MDEYLTAAQLQLQQIHEERMEAQRNIEGFKHRGDYATMGAWVEELANIEARAANISALHQQYIKSQTPVPVAQPSKEELDARPIDRMTWQDTWEMISKDTPNNSQRAAMARKFEEGMAQVMNEKNRR